MNIYSSKLMYIHSCKLTDIYNCKLKKNAKYRPFQANAKLEQKLFWCNVMASMYSLNYKN